MDAEPQWDGLFFEIDGNGVLGTRDSPISSQSTFKTVEYNLTAGVHVLAWGYRKDFSKSEGQDRAFLKVLYCSKRCPVNNLSQDFEIIGTELAPDECRMCPPGTFASSLGMRNCTECGPNTYNNEEGESSCHDCPSDKYSFPGATECSPRRGTHEPCCLNALTRTECTDEDYIETYTPCDAIGKREKIYVYKEPVICNKAKHQLPRSEANIPCG